VILKCLVKQAIKKHDVRIAFTHSGENEFIVGRPGNTASDERTALSEIREWMHFPVGRGEKPKIRAKGVVQRERQPLAVRRKDGVEPLPCRNAVAGYGRKQPGRSRVRVRSANFVVPETVDRFQELGVRSGKFPDVKINTNVAGNQAAVRIDVRRGVALIAKRELAWFAAIGKLARGAAWGDKGEWNRGMC
jgi:hypothetical protein